MDPNDDLGFIHQFRPAGHEGAATLLLLHGTGGDERDLLPLGRALAPEAALLSPRGKVLEHGMPRFFRRHAEGVFDIPDLIVRAGELAAFVRAATERYSLDGNKIVALGFSNGANIAAALLLLHPEILRGALLFAPMVPLEPENLPDLSNVAALLSAGRTDPIAPPEQAERLAEMLTAAGANTTLRWHQGGHTLLPEQVDQAREWLGKFLSAIEGDPGRPLP